MKVFRVILILVFAVGVAAFALYPGRQMAQELEQVEGHAEELRLKLEAERRAGEDLQAQVNNLQQLLVERELLLLELAEAPVYGEGEEEPPAPVDDITTPTVEVEYWLAGYAAERYPGDFVHEGWSSTGNPERLAQFAQNHAAGVPDLIFVRQDSSPAFFTYILLYPGDGDDIMVQRVRSGGWSMTVADTITLIDGYYYFTQGPVTVEDGVITYYEDGEEISVEFETFPRAQGQPMKLGVNGSGWVHP